MSSLPADPKTKKGGSGARNSDSFSISESFVDGSSVRCIINPIQTDPDRNNLLGNGTWSSEKCSDHRRPSAHDFRVHVRCCGRRSAEVDSKTCEEVA